jgi:hypothetical protein
MQPISLHGSFCNLITAGVTVQKVRCAANAVFQTADEGRHNRLPASSILKTTSSDVYPIRGT